jgi:hypothetical protein
MGWDWTFVGEHWFHEFQFLFACKIFGNISFRIFIVDDNIGV